MYRTLDPDGIVETISRLENRIAERFPGSGLRKVCAGRSTCRPPLVIRRGCRVK